jgi:hypothetical protein
MHFRHIKIQADRLPDCVIDPGIHHGQEAAFATFYLEENFRTERLDYLHMTVNRGEIPFVFPCLGPGYIDGAYSKDDILPHVGLIGRLPGDRNPDSKASGIDDQSAAVGQDRGIKKFMDGLPIKLVCNELDEHIAIFSS